MRMHLFIFNSFSLVSSNCVLSAQIYASIVAFLVTVTFYFATCYSFPSLSLSPNKCVQTYISTYTCNIYIYI